MYDLWWYSQRLLRKCALKTGVLRTGQRKFDVCKIAQSCEQYLSSWFKNSWQIDDSAMLCSQTADVIYRWVSRRSVAGWLNEWLASAERHSMTVHFQWLSLSRRRLHRYWHQMHSNEENITAHCLWSSSGSTSAMEALFFYDDYKPSTLSQAVLFLPRCSMQAVFLTAKVSVRPSVCPSHAWIVTKRKHLAKKVQLWLIGSRLRALQWA